MNKFARNLLSEWRKLNLPFEDETFIAAISGGADSVSLALALNDLRERKKLRLRFVMAHFNHGLRGAESTRDAEFVRGLAQKLDFEFALGAGKIPKKGNLEQNSRIARYEFLTATARNFDASGILTAHTINDQAETFLLNLIRGSGIQGLSAMKPVTGNYDLRTANGEPQSQDADSQTPISIIRPLLNWATREETENYCHSNQTAFCRDLMNEDLDFKRVRIRKMLLPLLGEFNPHIVETLARTASLLQTSSLIEERSHGFALSDQTDFLALQDLKKLSKSALFNVLREWLKAKRGNLRRLDLKHIEAIERLIFSRKSGRMVELPGGEMIIRKDGKLYWQQKNVENIGQST